ncbi:protein phosphatase 2C domain-containing protein [Nocardiopsis sp. EMB25]|uniref:PP2C family protein-serine/threonine phosphatase n=2 Tax=Nocardiopsis TaxID=2013 RepID=UPI0022852B45|nr:protein phosphatase 2C domain-containing protein [Nocardiopsis sp. EMB25]MCY9787211.1 protein phosphatase 2C domain-containing protein [Nocardiopsis sp. EMB25]
MSKVRTCPACADRVAAGDSFCEGCGRTLPSDIRDAPAENPDTVPTAPQVSLSGATRPSPDGGERPGLTPEDGAPTAPQVSLSAATRPRSGGGADALATQPLRRDAVLPAPTGEPRGPADGAHGPAETSRPPRPSGQAGSSEQSVPTVPEWPPPATGSVPVTPTNPALCTWCPGRVRDGYCMTCGLLQPTGRDHVEVSTESAAGVSDRGLRHKRNEDAMAVRVLPADDPHAPGAVLAVVCDGVSTSPRPDEASRVTAEAGVAVLVERMRQGADPREATGAAMTHAARAVAAIAESPRSAPACTFVSAVVRPDTGTVTVGWVGDSRAYWLSGGPAASASALLTKDDSWSEAMVQMGMLSREEAMRSANAHALVAWMGADSGEVDAHVCTVTPTGPGAVVLCTDGLWNYYPEAADLTAAVPGAGTAPREAARRYVDLAIRAGGKDNITVVVIPVPGRRGGPRAGQV